MSDFSIRLQQRLLVTLASQAAPMSVSELEARIRCARRDLWGAIRTQHNLGNLRRGQPVQLTAAARAAITAGLSLNGEGCAQ